MTAPPSSPPDPVDADDALEANKKTLLLALQALARPMARLAVAQGLRFASVEELMKVAFVEAAKDALRTSHPHVATHRMVSRISTTTGIHRREVTRISHLPDASIPSAKPSLATQLFTRWITYPNYRNEHGDLLALPRQGAAPSFEDLAQSITRDVHPRSMLDELCRLHLADWDTTLDMVSLQQTAFVPKGDLSNMLAFVGDNVGDHLAAAVSNVMSDEGAPHHFEQALFSDNLSTASVPLVKAMVQKKWQKLLVTAIPLIEKLIEEDRAAGRAQDQRIRVGLFSYSEQVSPIRDTDPASDTDSTQERS